MRKYAFVSNQDITFQSNPWFLNCALNPWYGKITVYLGKKMNPTLNFIFKGD